jgi:hypothetical protein
LTTGVSSLDEPLAIADAEHKDTRAESIFHAIEAKRAARR